MKAFEMKRLMLAALVASLPIACGTSTPMGPDGAADTTTVTALRVEPLPPTAPEAPSPEADTVPPKPGVPPSSPGLPQQTDPQETDPAPADNGPVPTPPSADPGSVPTTRPPVPVAGPVAVPPPPTTPEPNADRVGPCLAVYSEIAIVRGSLPQPLRHDPVLLEVLMLDSYGKQITDRSCNRVVWSLGGEGVGVGFAAGAIITAHADMRFATVDGSAGSYVIRATTPNGVTASVWITLY